MDFQKQQERIEIWEIVILRLENKVFRHVIGNPMGSDPAPFMANLFLYYYESKWVKNLKKDSLQKARRFRHTFRFIDDLLTINDNNLFLQNFKDIYIYILQSWSYTWKVLETMSLLIGHSDVKLFDKRDSFPFAIDRLHSYQAIYLPPCFILPLGLRF